MYIIDNQVIVFSVWGSERCARDAGFQRGISGLYLRYLWMSMLFLALVMTFWVRIWLLGAKVVTTGERVGDVEGVKLNSLLPSFQHIRCVIFSLAHLYVILK